MKDIFIAPKKQGPEEKAHSFLNDPHHMNFFSAFFQRPQGVSFQTQKPDERIILFLRSHFLTNLSWIIISIVLVILPLIASIFLSNMNFAFLSLEVTSRYTTIFAIFYYLMVSSYVFISFLHWFYNVFIVTSERVVDIDYSDIVVHNIAVTSLTHVQDVNYTQSGFIPTFFNYGDLFVQTAGNEKNFEALSIPRPREATHIIGDLTGKGPK